ncbi:cytochrome c oxidase subunit VIa-domain-containing protein [Syncephalis fuscata]|nr:cytochrome c oxidase subunit VIa-domain-containing protein [Syncephalis fuscata]
MPLNVRPFVNTPNVGYNNDAFILYSLMTVVFLIDASALWFKVSIAAIPALIVASYNAYRLMVEHEEHMKHHHEENIKYPYLMIRKKPFPFGDGNHTLFYNAELNDKYEE